MEKINPFTHFIFVTAAITVLCTPMVINDGNDADADQDFQSGAVDVIFMSGQEFSDCVIPLLADEVVFNLFSTVNAFKHIITSKHSSDKENLLPL